MVYGYDACVIVYVNIFEEFQVVDFWQRKHSLRRIWIRWTELFLLDPSASKEFRSNNPTLSQATEKFRLRTLCPSIETSHPVIGGSSAKVATRSLFLFFFLPFLSLPFPSLLFLSPLPPLFLHGHTIFVFRSFPLSNERGYAWQKGPPSPAVYRKF